MSSRTRTLSRPVRLPFPVHAAFHRLIPSRARPVDQFISKNRVPHLLFYGPPGTGKTSTILAVARKIYGSGALLRNNCLEASWPSRLGASDSEN